MADKKINSNLIIDGTISHQDGGAANEVFTTDGSRTNLPTGGVVFVANEASLPGTGVVDTLYIAKTENSLWEWNGSSYDALSSSGGGLTEPNYFVQVPELSLSSVDSAGVSNYLNTIDPPLDISGKNLYIEVIPSAFGAAFYANPSIASGAYDDHVAGTVSFGLTMPGAFTVDWGDGVTEELSGGQTWISHSYGVIDQDFLIIVTVQASDADVARVQLNHNAVNSTPIRFKQVFNSRFPFKVSTYEFAHLENADFSELAYPISISNAPKYAFWNCIATAKINGLERWDMSSVTDVDSLFYGCNNLEIAEIGGWNMSNVTTLRNTFQGCYKLNANVENWDVSKVLNLSSTFNNCYVFNRDLSGWNITSQCTTLYLTFNNCYLFNSDISGWDVSNVTDFGFTFSGCTAFNQDLSSWDISSATDMQYMFGAVANAQSPTLDTAYVDNMYNAWNALPSPPQNITIHMGQSYYSAASSVARANLISTHGWTINDKGLQ